MPLITPNFQHRRFAENDFVTFTYIGETPAETEGFQEQVFCNYGSMQKGDRNKKQTLSLLYVLSQEILLALLQVSGNRLEKINLQKLLFLNFY